MGSEHSRDLINTNRQSELRAASRRPVPDAGRPPGDSGADAASGEAADRSPSRAGNRSARRDLVLGNARILALLLLLLALGTLALGELGRTLQLIYPIEAVRQASVHFETVGAFLAGMLLLLIGSEAAVLILRDRLTRRGGPPDPSADPRPGRRSQAHSLVVAITAYNDALATEATVREFLAQPEVAEVLVIDNNSTDDTVRLATAAGARVIHEANQGYGHACMRGLREGLGIDGATAVVLVEGDGTFSAADLPKFLSYIDQSDMVIGTRVVQHLVEPGSQMDHFFTWGNMFVALLLRLRFWDTQYLGRSSVSDCGCTYRMIRTGALRQIIDDLEVGGMHFSLHMMLITMHHRLQVVEAPVSFRRRWGRSKGGSQSLGAGLRVGLAMIWHIMVYIPRSARTRGMGAASTAIGEAR